MYAIIETGGKQLKVEKDQVIYVEKLDAREGDTVTFDKVLYVSDKDAKIGNPYIQGARVTARVEKQGRSRKIVVYKYKAKVRSSHRKQGHRQPYTKLTITAIEA